MKIFRTLAIGAMMLLPASAALAASPAADQQALQAYFHKRFPTVAMSDYINGPYAMDAAMRAQWNDIMQFPPYDFAVDDGKTLFNKPFANGKTYASCFADGGIGIAQNYPKFDPKTGRVVTLEIAINRCRTANGEPKLDLTDGDMADIAAYMTDTSRGKKIAVVVPTSGAGHEAYEAGKEYFYTRRGQLNFSCASCHVQGAGDHLRGDVLAPALGLTAAFPLYRSTWGAMGTVARRFIECNTQVRAVPEKADSADYRNLEYFLAYMNNGLPDGGPGDRP